MSWQLIQWWTLPYAAGWGSTYSDPKKGEKKNIWGSFWMEMCCAPIRLCNFLVCSFVFLVTVVTNTMPGVKFVWYLILAWSHYKCDIDHITPHHCMQWARANNSDRQDFTCCVVKRPRHQITNPWLCGITSDVWLWVKIRLNSCGWFCHKRGISLALQPYFVDLDVCFGFWAEL